MDVGYVRVSTREQNPEMQEDALKAAGCGRVFSERISTRKEKRPELEAAMDYCREGDVLVVWRLDRLGRSIRELIELVGKLQERGVGFRSLQENIDTTTAGGKLVFHIFASLAEFERDLIRERTMAGLEAARARGRSGGRPKALDEKKLQLASRLMRSREMTIPEVCQAVGVGRTTLYRYLKPDGTPRDDGGS